MFGGPGILAGSVRSWACIPLNIRLHDGLQAAREWEGACVSEASHVVQMVEDAYHAALTLTAAGTYAWRSSPKRRSPVLLLKNQVHADPGGDAHAKKGAVVHLKELRFVLVEMDGVQSIFASTSLALDLDPLSIIRLYSYRFRIECTFRELKQQVGAFCYHFWSRHMPELNRYRAFAFILLERSVLNRSVTRGHLPRKVFSPIS